LPLKPDAIVTDLTPHQIEQMSEQELLAHIHYQRSLQMEVAQKGVFCTNPRKEGISIFI
jgi:hypothetical protein